MTAGAVSPEIAAALEAAERRHIPVLLDEVLDALTPQEGDVYLDGTFGAGGYTRAILNAAPCKVIALDRDPNAIAAAEVWAPLFHDRLTIRQGVFSDLEALTHDVTLDGIVLDIGVSSMQIDEAERGFSFMRDGPLDMRMGEGGVSAADIVNEAEEQVLADIFYQYGEERRSRALAKAIVSARAEEPFETTGRLVHVIERASPRKKPGQPHPATRAFQGLRIAVNDELGELVEALAAAERVLPEGGTLAVVTFHSLEDRIVKRFFQERSGKGGAGVSRHLPEPERLIPSFEPLSRKAVEPSEAEIARNPRARSSRLRAARRLGGAARPIDAKALGLPVLPDRRGRK